MAKTEVQHTELAGGELRAGVWQEIQLVCVSNNYVAHMSAVCILGHFTFFGKYAHQDCAVHGTETDST